LLSSHNSLLQSLGDSQASPSSHGEHDSPPQSTSVSLPFIFPSRHCSGIQR